MSSDNIESISLQSLPSKLRYLKMLYQKATDDNDLYKGAMLLYYIKNIETSINECIINIDDIYSTVIDTELKNNVNGVNEYEILYNKTKLNKQKESEFYSVFSPYITLWSTLNMG